GSCSITYCFQTSGQFFAPGVKIPVHQAPAHVPAC
ncbi:hypothetical protein AJOOGB_AJOOGB_06640, partial [Dysosmobacter welbionis]